MTIKLASLKADLDREEKGDWIDYPDWPGVSFLVSSSQKPAYVTARDMMMQRFARQYKGKPVPRDVLLPALGKLFAQHILHGWRGLDVDYDREVAMQTLTDPAYRDVVTAVEHCAARVSELELEFVEDEAKNSVRPSASA